MREDPNNGLGGDYRKSGAAIKIRHKINSRRAFVDFMWNLKRLKTYSRDEDRIYPCLATDPLFLEGGNLLGHELYFSPQDKHYFFWWTIACARIFSASKVGHRK